MYLITKSQFIQIIEQETGRGDVEIDFEKAIKENYVFAPGSWYGKIIYLGQQHGNPIFTFTNPEELVPTKPSLNYLKTIAIGIKECYQFSNKEIAQYLAEKPGAKGVYSQDELEQMLVGLD